MASWLEFRDELEPLFGPTPDFAAALRRNIDRGTAFCVRCPDHTVAGGMLLRLPPRHDPAIGWLGVRTAVRGAEWCAR